MVLIETSAWLDFLYYNDHPLVDDYIDDLLISNEIIYTTPIILQEVLQGAKTDKEFKGLRADFQTFDKLTYSDQAEAAIRAADLYRKCRKQGKTIRKPNDCMISLVCLDYGLDLLTVDRDFENIAEVYPLKLVKP